jgi:hypothetical protein
MNRFVDKKIFLAISFALLTGAPFSARGEAQPNLAKSDWSVKTPHNLHDHHH